MMSKGKERRVGVGRNSRLTKGKAGSGQLVSSFRNPLGKPESHGTGHAGCDWLDGSKPAEIADKQTPTYVSRYA